MASRGGKNVFVCRHAQGLMYMVVILQLLGAACAFVAGPAFGFGFGGFRRPEGGEDGIYQGFVHDENGEKQLKYLGKANTTSPGPNLKPGGISGPGRKLLHHEGVICQDGVDPSDAYAATSGLADFIGDGKSFSVVIAHFWKTATAYGCDYGSGQHTTSTQIWSDAGAISETCGGWKTAGWYSHNSWKSSYGRCPVDRDIC